MRIVIFIIIIFFINSINAKASETNTNNFQIEPAKELLKKHCYTCVEKSLQTFEKVTLELEEIVQINSNDKEATDIKILLLDSYEILIYKFYYSNKFKQSIYRNKQYNLLENIIKNGKSVDEIVLFSKKLRAASKKAWEESNKIGSDTEHSVYMGKLQELSKGIDSHIREIKAQPPNKIIIINKRARNVALLNLDLKLIDEIVNELFALKHRPSRENKVYFKHLINTLSTVVKSNQLNKNQLSKISRSAIVLQSYHFASEWVFLDDIIWWCEVRSIQNEADQLQFLNNQMLSTRKLDALKMLVELGEVEPIERWSKKLNFENSETMFNLAVKQAKLRQATIQKNINLAKLFEQEISQSLNEITQQKQQDNSQYQQHIHWLIVQIGTHRKDNQFKKMLENLAKDNLFYNKSLTKTMSSQEKNKLSNELESKFKISIDAQFILNSDSD